MTYYLKYKYRRGVDRYCDPPQLTIRRRFLWGLSREVVSLGVLPSLPLPDGEVYDTEMQELGCRLCEVLNKKNK